MLRKGTRRHMGGMMFTKVSMVNVLFDGTGSKVLLLTWAVLRMRKPLGSLALALTTSTKVAVLPADSVAALAVTVPVPPGAGLLRLKAGPPVCANDTKVVPVGTMSVNCTP